MLYIFQAREEQLSTAFKGLIRIKGAVPYFTVPAVVNDINLNKK